MKVTADKKTLIKLGRYWKGKAFKDNSDLQAYADQIGTINFLARIAIAEHALLGDISMDFEIANEELDRRIDDVLAGARAVRKMILR